MKKYLFLPMMLILGLVLLAACGGTDEPAETNGASIPAEPEALAGILEIRDNVLYITPSDVFVLYTAGVEFGFVRDMTLRSITFIENNDTQRMAEFGLTFDDFMPSGFYVGESGATRSFVIDDETEFVFVDSQLLFDTDPYGYRRHTTNSLDDFLQYFFPTVIHFIEVQDGRVIRVVQEFGFTM